MRSVGEERVLLAEEDPFFPSPGRWESEAESLSVCVLVVYVWHAKYLTKYKRWAILVQGLALEP
jgi:hypothetical protein